MIIPLWNVTINSITENHKKKTPREQNAKASTAIKIGVMNGIISDVWKCKANAENVWSWHILKWVQNASWRE